MNRKISVSVVIPNYNGKALLQKNLPFLYHALQFGGIEDYEVIIPDDSSTDDSVNFIKNNYPDIKVITSSKNLGFSPNINKGIFAATKDLTFALNSDVQLTESYFVHLLKYFSKNDTFGVTGRVMNMEENQIQDSAKLARKYFNGRLSYLKNYYCTDLMPDEWLPSFYLTGSNALFCTKKLKHIGGFNELFAPFYVEDVELGIRAWKFGWKCYYEHKAVCRHKTSSTIKSSFKRQKIRESVLRNKLYLHAIHLDASDKFLYYLKITFDLLSRWIILNFSFYKAFYSFLKNYKQLQVSTQKFEGLFDKNHKRLSIKEILLLIDESIPKEKVTEIRN